MRIIHFSDVHTATGFTGWGMLFDKRLLGTLNHLCRRAARQDWRRVAAAVTRIRLLSPHLVICTGDVTTVGEPTEFSRFLDAFSPLLEDPRIELLYVPGNHDSYTASARTQRSLAEAFHLLNRGRWQLADLPLVYQFQQLRFVLVNEARPMPFYSSGGAVDERTRAWWAAQFAAGPGENPARLALVGHFPLFDPQGRDLPRRHGCRQLEPFQQALRQGTLRFSFCGHLHQPFVRTEECGSTEYGAGSLTETGLLNLVDYSAVDDQATQRWVNVLDDGGPLPESPGVGTVLEGV